MSSDSLRYSGTNINPTRLQMIGAADAIYSDFQRWHFVITFFELVRAARRERAACRCDTHIGRRAFDLVQFFAHAPFVQARQ